MAEPCPATDVLEAYLRQALPDAQSDGLRPHVISCRGCQATLARLHYATYARERKRRRRSRRSAWSWLRVMVPWHVVVTILMAAIIAAGMTWLFMLATPRK